MSDSPIVIKKYENRRLYDTSASRYVNLSHVADLVREGREVQVLEARSGTDVTRQVMTQIIVESSRGKEGPPLEFLRDLVKTTDRAQRDFLHWYLGGAMELYRKLQVPHGDRVSDGGVLPWQRVGRWWEQTGETDVLAKLFGGLLPGARHSSEGKSRPEAEAEAEDRAPQQASASRQEVLDLRRRLEELERRLAADDE